MIRTTTAAALLAFLWVGMTVALAAEPPRPNVLLVLCDDLGYGDLACYGHPKVQTPHIDHLAREGLRLTNCYAAAPNCSPSRTGLMTGRTPYRVGIHDWIPMFSPMHVRRSEITIATLLRNAGYDTCHAGKWHLNGQFNSPAQPQPWDHGFNHWFSTQNNALPNHRHPNNFVRNGKPLGALEGYSAPLVAAEAIRWLESGREREKPFFLYVCFHEPHEPIATDPQYAKLYPSDDPSLSAHHGNITQMDSAFGRLMQKLDELKLRDNTLVFFTSDNGPAITPVHPHGSAGPLRDKKGSVYEGGIRVPGILRWPGHVQPGSVSHEPVCGVDLLPTLCALTGIEPPKDRTLDGADISPIFAAKSIERTQPLYWQLNRAHCIPKVALRSGDWKILATLTGAAPPRGAGIEPGQMEALKSAELETFELYNLAKDPGETTDLATQEPQTLGKMSELLRKLYHDVRAESPTWPVWEWPRYEGERIEWPAYRKLPARGGANRSG
jgi:arylsulfatase A